MVESKSLKLYLFSFRNHGDFHEDCVNIIMKDLVEFAAQYGIVQNTLLRELSIPYAILLDDGKAVWMNDESKQFWRKAKRRSLHQ